MTTRQGISRCWACIAIAVLLPIAALATDQPEPGAERWVVQVDVSSQDDVNTVAHLTEPWEVDLDQGVLITDVDDDGLALLADLGLNYTIDVRRTERLHSVLRTMKAGAVSGIPGFPCYRTVEETLATGAALAAAYPQLAEWIDIGDSWEKAQTPLDGYDLMILKLTNQAIGGDKPKLWVEGAIHARELTTAELATRFAEHLLSQYGIDPDVTWLLDHHEIDVLLQTNPDGRKHAENGESWRKNTNATTCGYPSGIGVDLNRNFSFYWGCCGGSSSDGCSDTYRGAAAASEPETQAVQDYIRANYPDQRPDDLTTPAPLDATGTFIDLHSYGKKVYMSWAFSSSPPPNADGLLTLGRKFAYWNHYQAALGSTGIIDGSTKDFSYGELGIPGYTIELGDEFFEECTPFESTIYPDNLDMLLYAAKAVRAPYTIPFGPDVLTLTAVPNTVAPGELITITATADDTRYEPGSGQPTQAIAAAEYYLDTPPWSPGAVANVMSASDGTFNSSVEGITAILDTTGLSETRHILYVRAQDATGTWGAVSAAFLWVLDPVTAPRIAGIVTSAADGTPIEATVTAGPFSTISSSVDGSYSLMVTEGTYTVTATADGFAPEVVSGVTATTGMTTTLDFELAPYQVVFFDDVEAGNIGWTIQSPWAITTEASASPTHSWTDSPGGSYQNYADVSLTSPVLDFSLVSAVVLEFKHIYDLESSWDFGRVEYRADGGPWTEVTAYSGLHLSWEQVELPIAALDGAQSAQIRFRLDADSYQTADGWHIDDIIIRGVVSLPPGLIFWDGFESGDTTRWSASTPQSGVTIDSESSAPLPDHGGTKFCKAL